MHWVEVRLAEGLSKFEPRQAVPHTRVYLRTRFVGGDPFRPLGQSIASIRCLALGYSWPQSAQAERALPPSRPLSFSSSALRLARAARCSGVAVLHHRSCASRPSPLVVTISPRRSQGFWRQRMCRVISSISV